MVRRSSLGRRDRRHSHGSRLLFHLPRVSSQHVHGGHDPGDSGSAGGLDRTLCDRASSDVRERVTLCHRHAAGARVLVGPPGGRWHVAVLDLAAPGRGATTCPAPARVHGVSSEGPISPGAADLVGLVAQRAYTTNVDSRPSSTSTTRKPGGPGSKYVAPGTFAS